MTKLLRQATQATETLPAQEQEHLAAPLIAYIRDEKFDATEDVIERLYDEAMSEYESGRTTTLGVC